MCLDCYNQYLPTLFETHFLNTSNCLILSAPFMWAEKPGIVNMSGNYTPREVPTKILKHTAHCLHFLHKSPIVSHFDCYLFFCLIPLSTLCVVCSHMYHCMCVTTHARGCRCVRVSATLSFCGTVSVCLDIIMPVFHCDCVFANVCDRISEKSQSCLCLG